ncbi:MAG: hypothetical protein QG573_258 [Acidobacteriota bacterium]|nr:hypothetical protein [Acidobacteriota bacterium]
MSRATWRGRLPTLLVLLLAAAGLAPDLSAQAAAPTPAAPAVPAAPAGVRTLYLVRHGAYDIDDPRDEAVGRALLPIGVAQARLTGDRLRGLPFALDSIVASPLTRARETAEVIAAELAIGNSGGPGVGFDPDLAECTPPTRRADIMAKEKPEELAACSAQLERLAARLLAPAPAGDRRELVVAHGNVIRWLVTRALAVDPAAWLGMSIGHASITVLAIDGKGMVRVLAVGDVGHLSPGMQTGAYGNRENWDLTAPAPSAGPIVLMISFDGFRWDYPELHGAPALLALAHDGVRAKSLVPSFPSKTFPNHHTLVTGLRPEHHGIVANTMWDPEWKAQFSLADRTAVEDGRWWGGEPVWVTAERRGLVTASSFWPGSEAAIGEGDGVRPTFWGHYDDTVPDEKRVDEVLGWLDLPAEKRPRLITLYFAEPDSGGHDFGPASPQAAAAVAHVDSMLARLRAGVAARGLADAIDWIVVSDHGMSATDPERTIVLADLVDLSGVAIDDLSVFGLLRPRPGSEDAFVRALEGAHPHLHAARKSAVPEGLHYRAHRRIPEVVIWADAGWTIFASAAARAQALADFSPGNHGYDPAERDMHGIFVAAGPSFKKGITTPPLDNVDVYPLLARLLGLAPAPNDGNAEATAGMLGERMP